MKKSSSVVILAVLLALAAGSAHAAPYATGDDGLGYMIGGDCDSAPDADGDGIPNGQDSDYLPPLDGSGSQFGTLSAVALDTPIRSHHWFRYMWMGGLGPMVSTLLSTGYGPGDGLGFDGDGPADGTGYGPGDCTGDCDGTFDRDRLHWQ